jgi:hypothetical protein
MVGPTAGQASGAPGLSGNGMATGDVPRDYLRKSIRAALRAGLDSAGERLPSNWHLHAHGLSSPSASTRLRDRPLPISSANSRTFRWLQPRVYLAIWGLAARPSS